MQIFKNPVKDFFANLFSDAGDVSSKRVIGLVGSFIIFGLMAFSVIKGIPGDVTMQLLDYSAYIVMVALFGNVAEQFLIKRAIAPTKTITTLEENKTTTLEENKV